jgi:hypothetical protein
LIFLSDENSLTFIFFCAGSHQINIKVQGVSPLVRFVRDYVRSEFHYFKMNPAERLRRSQKKLEEQEKEKEEIKKPPPIKEDPIFVIRVRSKLYFSLSFLSFVSYFILFFFFCFFFL